MHIGLDARLPSYRKGGISTYITRLIQALEALDSAHHYTVFSSRKAGESPPARFQHASLWTPCHHRFERIALSAELLRFNLDLLHSPDFIPPLRGARRYVITVHDLNFLHYPQFLTAESRRYYNGHIARAVAQADHILVDSNATRLDLIDMLGAPPGKITVHMLGVDARFQPLPDEQLAAARERYNLPRGYILFVGTFEPRKNLPALLRAYRLLRERLPGAPPLLLAGSRGWQFGETMALAGALQIDAHVIWRENLPDDALPALYNLADVLVMPSFHEGFGLPALEAMACGTPPIVSARASLPEVVGDVGLQIDPDAPESIAEALEKALTDSAWRAAMREAALARAAQFTWERTAQTVLSVYNRLH